MPRNKLGFLKLNSAFEMLSSLLRKKRIIIGIHGIGNKPPQPLLQMWWRRAICEGLERIDARPKQWKFELVYWSPYLYKEPQSLKVSDPADALHIDFPYVRASNKTSVPHQSKWRMRLLDSFEFILDRIFLTESRFFNFERISDYIIRKKFADLAKYLEKEVKLQSVHEDIKKEVRGELARVLRKHRRKEIMLISHSMGTIVAYDVLTQLVPGIKIHTLITLGSPLGLPAIMKRIYSEQNKHIKAKDILTAPGNIEHAWLNFSDLNDAVAMNYNLADDFGPNSKGLGPEDIIVSNDYEYNGKKNPHKSYGYLRAPEVAGAIKRFLMEERTSALETIKGLLQQIMGKKTEPELSDVRSEMADVKRQMAEKQT